MGANEIAHGKVLAAVDSETIWGWGTPAGRVRAARRAAIIMQGAGLSRRMKVLEIGCGTGLFTEMFARTGARLLAVDISEELLQKARARALPPEQVQFMAKRFEDCDIHGPFDAVIGSSILHHLDIPLALKKIQELLKPGGTMSFAEPNLLNPQIFAERRFRRFFRYVSPDETAFVRWRLTRLLKSVGFIDVKTRPFDWLHPSVPEKWIARVRQFGNQLENLKVLREFSGSIHVSAVRPR